MCKVLRLFSRAHAALVWTHEVKLVEVLSYRHLEIHAARVAIPAVAALISRQPLR